MIKAEEISEIIKRQLQGYEAEIDLQEAGRVIEVGDGIARIYGLDKALAGELLEFPGGVYGLVLNLEADNVEIGRAHVCSHVKSTYAVFCLKKKKKKKNSLVVSKQKKKQIANKVEHVSNK